MKTRNRSRSLKPLPHIQIVLGTIVLDIAALAWTLCRKFDLAPEIVVQRLIFDWKGKISCHWAEEPTLELESCFGPEDFVEARLSTDQAALQKAEDRGDLYAVQESWLDHPGSVVENMGAGGDPRMGQILAILNQRRIRRRLRKMIQQAIAHSHQDQRVIEDLEDGRMSTRLTATLRFSAVGGMGSGAMQWFLGEDGIQACARQDGVEISVIAHVLCRGNLETKDDERIDLNQFIAIKHLQALSSTTYVSPLTGRKQPTPCTALFLASNQNENGDVTDLRRVQAHEAHCDHYLRNTPGGARMRELLIDILEPEHNEYGEPLVGKTMACAFLSRDRKRLLQYCAYRSAALLAGDATAPGDLEKVRQCAAGLARQASLVESDEDNELTGRLTHPDELGRQDVLATARGSFEDRTKRSRRLHRLVMGASTLQGILQSDIPQTYAPAMTQQGHVLIQTIQDLLEKHLDQRMRTRSGLSESRELYAAFALIARRSQEALMRKIAELKELLDPHEQIIAEATEEIEALQKAGWFTRHASLLLIQRLWASLSQSAAAAISYHLQMAACTIAINEVLMPVMAYLDNQLAWLDGMEQKLIQTARICDSKAESIAAQPTVRSVPHGLELTSREYLHDYFADYITEQGGQDEFASRLLGPFLQKYGSLAYLTDAPLEEYGRVFSEIAEAVVRPDIERTAVVSEFKRVYPDPKKQLKIFDRLIKQSEGCIQVTGEMDAPVTWIKTAEAPCEADAEWLREQLERSDEKPGTWEVQVHPDPDRIAIAQLRGQIPLQSVLDRCGLSDDPKTWARLVRHAPDPISVLIVPPNPTARQLRRVLAKAIATGQLSVDQKGFFVLKSSNRESLVLGSDFNAVAAFLKSRWTELVFAESTFGRNLVMAEDQTISALNDLKTQIQSTTSASDRLLGLVDLTAIEECLVQAELLLPRTRRIAAGIRKRGLL